MTISAPFAQALASERAGFNARVAAARHRYPALDTAAFAVFLQSCADDIVRAVAAIAPDRVAAVAGEVFGIALELVGQALAGPGARTTLVDRMWHELLPAYARLVAQHPAAVLGSLTNAVINIGKVPTANADQWLCEMASLAQHADDLAGLLQLGQIAAWRAGLAHFRTGAIAAADQLPAAVALAAVGASPQENWSAVRDNLLADPWWSPDDARGRIRQAGIEIGQFTGFGGMFQVPPELRACTDGFLVKSADRYRFLIADVYGAVLHQAGADEFERLPPFPGARSTLLDGSRLRLRDREIALDLPDKGLAATCNEHTVAITSPYTHAIALFPLR
jgi:hypothetical protein